MKFLTALTILAAAASTARAANFASLDEALNPVHDIASIAPVFDFDGDGCFPGAAISREGAQNPGLDSASWSVEECRRPDFLKYSNTYHRGVCTDANGKMYCAHFYCLYFQKDQALIAGGHRHDVEHVAVWTTDGTVTHVGASAHGKTKNSPIADLDKQDGHVKIVYHQDDGLTNALRFSKKGEKAENPYDTFVTPPIVDWYYMVGDGLSNEDLKAKLNGFDFGSAHFPILDGDFYRNVNEARPEGYPAVGVSQ
ncbi:necrosis inducing [Gonapodya prolifera JEL478]|uniref:Necrosis inducing n=1 Tax=Gonapodya prolifera (strain JEL478) TaxID=1344416 RepID=A0A139AKD5_GONPJ|nr:necrosis inducing [Gonapodya prolifera JEL478]|eukprot:KXS17158.1 necrosis inducing [Gonapodya prolifera JEL478]